MSNQRVHSSSLQSFRPFPPSVRNASVKASRQPMYSSACGRWADSFSIVHSSKGMFLTPSGTTDPLKSLACQSQPNTSVAHCMNFDCVCCFGMKLCRLKTFHTMNQWAIFSSSRCRFLATRVPNACFSLNISRASLNKTASNCDSG